MEHSIEFWLERRSLEWSAVSLKNINIIDC